MARDKTDKTDTTPVATLATSATRAANEWGIPDWRDASAYGDVKRWTFYRWRWEFYRRREDLREVFLTISELEKESPELDFTRDGRPPRGQSGHYVYASTSTFRKFGYRFELPDPSVSAQPEEMLFAYEGFPPRFDIFSIGEAVTLPEQRVEANWLQFFFDLDKPLESQLAVAKRHLRHNQKYLHGSLLQRKRHPTKWLGYLRTLDAREAGASWREIAELHPNTAQTEQTARDIWNAADALRFNF